MSRPTLSPRLLVNGACIVATQPELVAGTAGRCD
jgi:hypothetical protein